MSDLKKALFSDRDGVINIDFGYVGSADRFVFTDGCPEALAAVKKAGFLTVLISNQSGVARGFFSEEDVDCLHNFMQQQLALQHAEFSALYYCPHHPDASIEKYKQECSCRKPAPGMILQACKDLNIDPSVSCMIGDKASDLEAAFAAGIKNLVLVGNDCDSECAALAEKGIKPLIFKSLYDFVFSFLLTQEQ